MTISSLALENCRKISNALRIFPLGAPKMVIKLLAKCIGLAGIPLRFGIQGMRLCWPSNLYCGCPGQHRWVAPIWFWPTYKIAIRFLAIIDACVFNYLDVQIVDEICVILARLLPRQVYHFFTIHFPFSGRPIQNCKFNSQKIDLPLLR